MLKNLSLFPFYEKENIVVVSFEKFYNFMCKIFTYTSIPGKGKKKRERETKKDEGNLFYASSMFYFSFFSPVETSQ